MKRILKLLSPAKVNLQLEILRKRPDGYHEIGTLFQKISLHDTIRLSLAREPGISVTTDRPGLPLGKGNLVYKAAEAVLARSPYEGGVAIHIAKRIPLGAGLGGGSSNAAATLQALNFLLEMGLTRKEMMALGVKIGADVPFFFLEKAAVATGIGERLKEVDLPKIWYVLIYPGFEVSTAWAYRNTRLTKERFRYKIHTFLTTPEAVSRILTNDLERVVSGTFPEIRLMKEMLCSHGALGSLMSGSGPTVYGIFTSEREAAKALRGIRREVAAMGWLVIKAQSLP